MSLWREVSIFAFFRDVVVCAAIAIGLGFPSIVMGLVATLSGPCSDASRFPCHRALLKPEPSLCARCMALHRTVKFGTELLEGCVGSSRGTGLIWH